MEFSTVIPRELNTALSQEHKNYRDQQSREMDSWTIYFFSCFISLSFVAP
jgi:hypothetical protein